MNGASSPHAATFRFFAELRDFLKTPPSGHPVHYRFDNAPGIKDPIEALGVPHTEVEHIVVNGRGVDFSYRLRDGDRVCVYPVSVATGIAADRALRPVLHHRAFVLDVHLGKLARLLRMLGIDSLYSNAYSDPELVAIAEREQRVLLTRDRRLLFHRRVLYGHFIRHSDALEQARDVIRRYRLDPEIQPFSRCIRCNGRMVRVDKQGILDQLEPKTILYYEKFYRCGDCGQVYWKGSHFDGMLGKFAAMGLNPP